MTWPIMYRSMLLLMYRTCESKRGVRKCLSEVYLMITFISLCCVIVIEDIRLHFIFLYARVVLKQQSFNVSTFQRFNVSSKVNISIFQGFNVSTFQGFNVSTFQRFNVSTFQRFNVSTL